MRIALLLAVGGAALWASFRLRSTSEDLIEPRDVQPPGRWHLQSSHLVEQPSGDELARVLSLPYVSGTTTAPARDGVIRYDTDNAFSGLNLYVSGHGPEVRLIDMEGRLLHRWQYPFEAAFPDQRPNVETDFYRRAYLYPSGDLLVLVQTGGIFKLDRDSNLLWATGLPGFNHLTVTEDGRILTIAKTARLVPEIRAEESILEDSIVVLTADGEIVERVSLLDCFANSAFADLIHPLPDYADVFHTNTVLPIPQLLAESSELFRPEFLMVSMREIDTVALVDWRAATVAAAWRGPWRAQHQPVPLPTGSVLLFDNKGGRDGSRVVEFDPISGELTWEFHGEDGDYLASPQAGSCQRLPNGNTLITESEMGRALEITPEKRVVWEFVSPHRAGEKLELIATLFDVIRYPAHELPFVGQAGSS